MGKKVIVIGAGCAGLYATHYLISKGVDVHCYEAEDHVGGRTYSYWKDGWLCETGALAVEPNYQLTYGLVDDSNTRSNMIVPDKAMHVGFFRNGKWSIIDTGGGIRMVGDILRFRGIPFKALVPTIKVFKAIMADMKKITPENAAQRDFSDLEF